MPAMRLYPGEVAAGPWRAVPVDDLVALLRRVTGAPAGRPAVVAVDGRGGGGKSTLADRLHAAVPASTVVHTDDVAWHSSFFGWQDLLAEHVLRPVRAGRAVSYRPAAWQERDRPGSMDVPAGLELVLVEGVGAGRRELADLLDAVVWVQSDRVEAERRALPRDVALGHAADLAAAKAFWDEWQEQEVPFLDGQRPWERACCVVAGTAVLEHGPGEVVLADPP